MFLSRRDIIKKSFTQEARDLLRGATGGLIFGTPILFTMEMWLHGIRYTPLHLLGVLFFAILLNTCFSYSSGLRRHNTDHNLHGALADAITALAIGIVLAVVVLALIGQLEPAPGFDSAIGKVIVQAAAISVGVTFTNTRFPRGKARQPGMDEYSRLAGAPLTRAQKQARLDFYNLAAVLGGATIFSFNVAPTEEIVLIAGALSPGALLVLLGAEFVVCYLILYAAAFKEKIVFKHTRMQTPMAEVTMTVAVALCVSALLLLLIGEHATSLSDPIFIAATITLGFPAVVGGAAGKVVV